MLLAASQHLIAFVFFYVSYLVKSNTGNKVILEFARNVDCEPKLKPGSFICIDCKKYASSLEVLSSQDFSSQSDTETAMGDAHDSDFTDSQEIRNASFQELDQVAAALGKSPLFSNKRLSSEQRQEIARKQLKKIVQL